MALKSMTGYGRSDTGSSGRIWTVEVKSVNNRFLDAKVKLPKNYAPLEDEIRRRIGNYHQRGRVDLLVSVTGDFSDLVKINVNIELAKNYRQSLSRLARELDIDANIDLPLLIGLPDVMTREQQSEDLESVRSLLFVGIDQALAQCLEMRRVEGEALSRDLGGRLQLFADLLESIARDIPRLKEEREKGLQERLDRLLGAVGLDPVRLAQEAAIIVDKADVTEEMVRLRSHIDQFEELLESDEPVGRKLDFLIQEFLREVNTIASKISDAETAHKTVSLKSELEKMREQIQNIE
jgi:uncharacterized protein (TIGR00255 family)